MWRLYFLIRMNHCIDIDFNISENLIYSSLPIRTLWRCVMSLAWVMFQGFTARPAFSIIVCSYLYLFREGWHTGWSITFSFSYRHPHFLCLTEKRFSSPFFQQDPRWGSDMRHTCPVNLNCCYNVFAYNTYIISRYYFGNLVVWIEGLKMVRFL